MRYYVFKTNIKSRYRFDKIKPVLKRHLVINDWWVDIEDRDHVLRVNASNQLEENDVIQLIHQCGFKCEVLPD